MDARTRRRQLSDRSLTIRMVALVVAIPLAVLAGVAALVVWLPASTLWWLGIGCLAGAGVSLWRHTHRARPPERVLSHADAPELMQTVERLCTLIGLRCPEVVLSQQRQANSWVVHPPRRPPRLYVTAALLELLDPHELQAVLAHELTHVANRDALVMTVVGAPGTVMLRARGFGPYGFALVAIGFVSATGCAMLSRCRELAADAGSATITGRPSALASALLRVAESQQGVPDGDLRAAAALNAFNLVAVRPRRGRGRHIAPLARALRTHPDIEQRVARLLELERRRQR